MHFTPKQPSLPAPQVTWDEGTLISNAYGDVYASRDGSVAETEYVFLAGNGFPERWGTQNYFTIAELGFGTGLNFFATWRQFLRHASPSAQLHFISTELVPLAAQDILRALAPYPELEWLASQFVARMPLRLAGIHHIQFERVTLTLCYGDAGETLPHLTTPVDAWFLDGFSPAKNPDMWSDYVLGHVARLGGSVATFSAAGEVKRRLESHGYSMEKREGFGHKRDMLVGKTNKENKNKSALRAVVIGGGVAGCATAYALARRGHQVTLYERNTIAFGASGNPAALLYPRITKHWSPEMSFYLSAMSYMLSHVAYWNATHEIMPLIKAIKDEQERERFTGITERTGIDSSILSFDTATQSLRMQGLCLDPRDLCAKLIRHSHIEVREQQEITALPEADVVVLCNAQDAQAFAPERTMKVNAGQVSLVPAHHVRTLPHALHCHKGYIIPGQNTLLIGATYDRDDMSLAVTDTNHRKNLEDAREALPDLFRDEDVADWTGRTSLRATTPTRMPHIGKLRNGLYINAGHGSRGMLSAPYGAELLVNEICNS